MRLTREEVDGVLVSRWETPVGALVERQKWCPESYSHGYVEHAVKSAADLKIVRFIEEARVAWAIPEIVEKCLTWLGDEPVESLEDVYACDAEARRFAREAAGRPA